jgi:hypothetical protein
VLRRGPLLALLGVAGALGGLTACGEDPGDRFELRTPPERSSARPLPGAGERQRPAGHEPTRAEAERQRPVIEGWARALRRGDARAAARYFALPAVIAQGASARVTERRELVAFNAGLPCGVRLLRVRPTGRFVVATFRLTERPGTVCDAPGQTLRVAFIIRRGRFHEWRRIAKTPGAEHELLEPGATEPEPPARRQHRA